jgi:serine/threonine protein kinase
MPLEYGVVFAGFVIERFLGSGAMGEVYLARHPRLPRLDALKVLPAALTDNAEFRRRFEREADVAATLWHPHIVGIHDRGEFDGQLWISMDYVEGTDAERLLSEHYPRGMPVLDVLDIVTAVADALDFAHERQLLHRDVKPSNVLLTAAKSNRRRILLADFGVARRADEVTGLTGTNMSVGSVGYAAPEQLKGERLDGRADQYALAATTFHLLTARMPFQHSNPAVVISKQLTAAVPRLAESRPDLGHLDRVLSVALAKDRNHRYPRCLDFAEALRRENPRPHTRPVTAPAEAPKHAVSPESTTSTPAETRAIKLRPGAADDPDKTRAMKLRPGAAAEPDETRAMKLQADAAAGPEKTRPMDFRRSTPSAPDATRAMKLPPTGGAVPDQTRAMKLPPTPKSKRDSETTRAMNVSLSAAGPPPPRADIARPAGTPAVAPGARRGTAGPRPPSGGPPGPRPPSGGPPARAPSTGPPARPVSKGSVNWELRKAIWLLVAVLVLIATVIAAGVLYWKVAVTGAPSVHRTVSESSMPMGRSASSVLIDPELPADGSRESYCRAVVEAYAYRAVPIVEHDYGFPEFIEHGETGFMTSDSDEMSYYASLLAHDPQRHRRMAEAGRRYLEQVISAEQACWEPWMEIH